MTLKPPFAAQASQLVLLDAGICVELPRDTHENMVQILAAMLDGRGADAGRLILAGAANADGSEPRDEAGRTREDDFCAGVDALVRAQGTQSVFESLSSYLMSFCSLAVNNKIVLDASFISVALAIKIMEGLVVDLNPDFEFLKVATPMFCKAGFTRASKKELAKLTAASYDLLGALRRAPPAALAAA